MILFAVNLTSENTVRDCIDDAIKNWLHSLTFCTPSNQTKEIKTWESRKRWKSKETSKTIQHNIAIVRFVSQSGLHKQRGTKWNQSQIWTSKQLNTWEKNIQSYTRGTVIHKVDDWLCQRGKHPKSILYSLIYLWSLDTEWLSTMNIIKKWQQAQSRQKTHSTSTASWRAIKYGSHEDDLSNFSPDPQKLRHVQVLDESNIKDLLFKETMMPDNNWLWLNQ
jgi:hypothetical protein